MANPSRGAGGAGDIGVEDPIPIPRHVPWIQPEHMTVCLPFAQSFRWQDNGGAQPVIQAQVYRLNSIWDPDYSGIGGAVAQGRDRWAKMYSYYRVLKTEVDVTYTQTSLNAFEPGDVTIPYNQVRYSSPVMVGGYFCRGTVLNYGDWLRIYESTSESKMEMLTGDVNTGNRSHIHFSWNPETTIRSEIQTQTQDQIWTPVASDPAVSQFLILFCDNLIPGAEYFEVTVVVTMKYTVQFVEIPRVLRTVNETGV